MLKNPNKCHPEARLRNAKWISEATKFNIIPLGMTLNCCKLLLSNYSTRNIEIFCYIIELCGRYLYYTNKSQDELKNLLNQASRIQKNKNLSNFENVRISNLE